MWALIGTAPFDLARAPPLVFYNSDGVKSITLWFPSPDYVAGMHDSKR